MAKAKKLPSGRWRTQIYDYTDSSGKRRYKSFTAKTKRESEFLAMQYATGRARDTDELDITLSTALDLYIQSKEGVLSPSTIRAYKSVSRNHFSQVRDLKLSEITNAKLQVWISELANTVSPKSVKNIFGLLSATLDMFNPDFHLKTTLPAKKKPDLYVPSDHDIKILLKHVAGTELEIAVLLAAFGPMRRGEICALESSDISGNIITVSKSMVMDENRQWHIKQPKTYSSYRAIYYPDFVIQKMKHINGRIIKGTPENITNRFRRAIISAGLPHFRFHDLRHYAASIMHAINVPDQYIMERGGWASDNVMKSVYRNVISSESLKQQAKIIEHFEQISHEISHEI